jgi:hypothetical protein
VRLGSNAVDWCRSVLNQNFVPTAPDARVMVIKEFYVAADGILRFLFTAQ